MERPTGHAWLSLRVGRICERCLTTRLDDERAEDDGRCSADGLEWRARIDAAGERGAEHVTAAERSRSQALTL